VSREASSTTRASLYFSPTATAGGLNSSRAASEINETSAAFAKIVTEGFDASGEAVELLGATVSGSGRCSEQDKMHIREAGPGNHDGTMPKIVGGCSEDNAGFFGFDKWAMRECVHRKARIGYGCANCYMDHLGVYGYDHCKWACMSAWCKQGCLKCLERQRSFKRARAATPHRGLLNSCLGMETPNARSC